MKTIKSVVVILFLISVAMASCSQAGTKAAGQQITDTFKVSGKCDMCKERIESAVKADGAASASWEEKTQMLTLTFDPAKTNKDKLCKKLASVGHDTEKYKAPDDVYAKLPGCCHYDRTR